MRIQIKVGGKSYSVDFDGQPSAADIKEAKRRLGEQVSSKPVYGPPRPNYGPGVDRKGDSIRWLQNRIGFLRQARTDASYEEALLARLRSPATKLAPAKPPKVAVAKAPPSNQAAADRKVLEAKRKVLFDAKARGEIGPDYPARLKSINDQLAVLSARDKVEAKRKEVDQNRLRQQREVEHWRRLQNSKDSLAPLAGGVLRTLVAERGLREHGVQGPTEIDEALVASKRRPPKTVTEGRQLQPGNSLEHAMYLLDKATGFKLRDKSRLQDRQLIKDYLSYAAKSGEGVGRLPFEVALKAVQNADPKAGMAVIRRNVSRYRGSGIGTHIDPTAALGFSYVDFQDGKKTGLVPTQNGSHIALSSAKKILKEYFGTSEFPEEYADGPIASVTQKEIKERDSQELLRSRRAKRDSFQALREEINHAPYDLGLLHYPMPYLSGALGAAFEELTDRAATASENVLGVSRAREDPDYMSKRNRGLGGINSTATMAANTGVGAMAPLTATLSLGTKVADAGAALVEGYKQKGWSGLKEAANKQIANYIDSVNPAKGADLQDSLERTTNLIMTLLGAFHNSRGLIGVIKGRRTYGELVHLYPELRNVPAFAKEQIVSAVKNLELEGDSARAIVHDTLQQLNDPVHGVRGGDSQVITDQHAPLADHEEWTPKHSADAETIVQNAKRGMGPLSDHDALLLEGHRRNLKKEYTILAKALGKVKDPKKVQAFVQKMKSLERLFGESEEALKNRAGNSSHVAGARKISLVDYTDADVAVGRTAAHLRRPLTGDERSAVRRSVHEARMQSEAVTSGAKKQAALQTMFDDYRTTHFGTQKDVEVARKKWHALGVSERARHREAAIQRIKATVEGPKSAQAYGQIARDIHQVARTFVLDGVDSMELLVERVKAELQKRNVTISDDQLHRILAHDAKSIAGADGRNRRTLLEMTPTESALNLENLRLKAKAAEARVEMHGLDGAPKLPFVRTANTLREIRNFDGDGWKSNFGGNIARTAGDIVASYLESSVGRIIHKPLGGLGKVEPVTLDQIRRIVRGGTNRYRAIVDGIGQGADPKLLAKYGGKPGLPTRISDAVDAPFRDFASRKALDDMATQHARRLHSQGKARAGESMENLRQRIFNQLTSGSNGPLTKGEVMQALDTATDVAQRRTLAGDWVLSRALTDGRERVKKFAEKGLADGRLSEETTDKYVGLATAAHSLANDSVKLKKRGLRVLEVLNHTPLGTGEAAVRLLYKKLKKQEITPSEARLITHLAVRGFKPVARAVGFGTLAEAVLPYLGVETNKDGESWLDWGDLSQVEDIIPVLYKVSMDAIDAMKLPTALKAQVKRKTIQALVGDRSAAVLFRKHGAEEGDPIPKSIALDLAETLAPTFKPLYKGLRGPNPDLRAVRKPIIGGAMRPVPAR